ncbi:UNVERIFIED_CONTAM: hypothetical protein GTU68_065209 [Idotea baltica]|nr:hypothetical protein [Idotea baltica]
MALAVDSFDLFLKDTLPFLKKIEEILSLVGLFYVGKVGLSTLCDLTVGLRAHVFSKFRRRNFKQRFGKWAVITGCTQGIGRCYAEELAKEGLNLILVSLGLDDLKELATHLSEKYRIDTEVVEVDFSHGRHVYEEISKHINNKEVGMLINNVGLILGRPKYFAEVTEDEIWGHINVNVGPACAMTKMILPQMVNRGRGAIVNLSSFAAFLPVPLIGIYSASKVFVDYFSQSLEWEYRNKGITVQTVTPNYVATNMTRYSPLIGTEGWLSPSPSVFAYHAVSTIGYTKRTTGYWLHGLQAWFVHNLIPRWCLISVMGNFKTVLYREASKAAKCQ